MGLTAIILAAGKSTRMKSARPKPLHEVCGKPMLGWILDACFDAGVERAILVVGHGKAEVIGAFGHDSRVSFVEQTQQLGTGHAARVCEPLLRDQASGDTVGGPAVGGDVFILAGDTPMIRGEVLKALLDAHRGSNAAASMATATLDDPTGYGRVLRDAAGEFLRIVEQIDCTPAEAAVREVFPSYYCVKIDELLWALGRLSNTTNKKGEYYLTDIYGILRDAGKKIAAVRAVAPDDVIAPNTRQQLAEADAAMQRRIQDRIVESGVTIVSPANTYVEADVTVGVETTVLPFSFVGRGARVGRDCTVGPFAEIPRDAVVPDGTTVLRPGSPESVFSRRIAEI